MVLREVERAQRLCTQFLAGHGDGLAPSMTNVVAAHVNHGELVGIGNARRYVGSALIVDAAADQPELRERVAKLEPAAE